MTKNSQPREDCVCIVGSGPTGMLAALTLVRAGIPVVMLESGGAYPRRLHIRICKMDLIRSVRPTPVEAQNGVDFVNDDATPVRWFRSYKLGGLSNFWSGIVMRYAPGDFTDGERLHEKYRWPISYDDLVPYYEKVESLIHVAGGRESYDTLPACNVARERTLKHQWLDIAKRCRDLERHLAVLPQVDGPATRLSLNGGPENVALRLLQRLKSSNRFQLITGAHVTRVLMDEKHARASGVEYINVRTGEREKIAAQGVILAAGALSSTSILLRSQSASFPNGLGNGEGLVGRYLHDHPMIYSQIETDFRFPALDDRRLGGLYVARQKYDATPPLTPDAFLLYGGSFLRLATYLLLIRSKQYFEQAKKAFAEWRDASNHLAALLGSSLIYVCWFGAQVPRPENHVLLDPEKTDAFGLPLLRVKIQLSCSERDLMKRAETFIPSLLASAGAKIHGVTNDPQPVGSSAHYGGTARMHASPEFGVLDQWNRVHGVQNVLVADSSSFTTCVEKNPTLTAMAMAMRAAHHLSREMRTW